MNEIFPFEDRTEITIFSAIITIYVICVLLILIDQSLSELLTCILTLSEIVYIICALIDSYAKVKTIQ